jgi:hypothetical protein
MRVLEHSPHVSSLSMPNDPFVTVGRRQTAALYLLPTSTLAAS